MDFLLPLSEIRARAHILARGEGGDQPGITSPATVLVPSYYHPRTAREVAALWRDWFGRTGSVFHLHGLTRFEALARLEEYRQ